MEEKKAFLTIKDGIGTVVLNNPKSFNSIDKELLDDTLEVIRQAAADPDIRVIVITGAGRAFCAGADLNYVQTISKDTVVRVYIESIARVSTAIANAPKPVIAMVNGVAAGAGFTWVLACDIIYVARSARFSQSFVKIGLVPDGGGPYFLTRQLSLCRAKELAFTGDVIDAETAERKGLFNKVVDDDTLEEETLKMARKLAEGPPIALAMMKKLFNMSSQIDLETCIEVETGMQLVCKDTEDYKEGVASFVERRQPVFKGR
jgi:2-(1,2-epoxy-1,2-dihydrophenyl)acetyl-CoA isomerase